MDKYPNSTLDLFLRAVQRRLWLLQLQDSGQNLFWFASIYLVVLGIIHRFIFPFTTMFVVVVTVVPAILLFARPLLRKPVIRDCAVRADKEFHGKALMTTALECEGNPELDETFASRAVLLQAQEAARSWLPSVSSRFSKPPTRATILAAIPLFVAMVLLSLPGADMQVRNANSKSATTMSSKVTVTHTKRGADDIARLRDILADEERTDAPVTSAPRRIDTEKLLMPAQINAGDAPPDETELAGREAPQGSVAGTSESDGNLPGSAVARSTPRSDSPAPAPRFLAREEIMLLRSGADASANANSAATFSAFDLLESNRPGNVPAAADPNSIRQWTILSQSQAEHARRYLAESGNEND
jgi:hypothetical protein